MPHNLFNTLQEFDLGNGKKGRAAIPIELHGAMEFNGTASGPVADLDVKGHLQAAGVELKLGTTDVQVDSLVADAEYSPNSGVLVARSTLKRGTAVMNAAGSVRPRKVVESGVYTSVVWRAKSSSVSSPPRGSSPATIMRAMSPL